MSKKIKQGNPFYFIEVLERRSINRNGKGRGKIGCLIILSYEPPNIKDLTPCNSCNIFMAKENLTKDRYVKGKPYCLNCLIEKDGKEKRK